MSDDQPNFWREHGAHLRSILKKERNSEFNFSRDDEQYILALNGLRAFFDYARTLRNRSKTILDVGSGDTKGAAGLQRGPYMHGLSMRATVLVKHPEITLYLGAENVYKTTAESLSGIESESIAGITGSYSIAYSNHLDKVAESFDRVLVPGGCIKVNFAKRDSGWTKKYGFKKSSAFMAVLKARGYDIYEDKRGREDVTVLVAIKPGNKFAPSAFDLCDADFATFGQQNEEIMQAKLARKNAMR